MKNKEMDIGDDILQEAYDLLVARYSAYIKADTEFTKEVEDSNGFFDRAYLVRMNQAKIEWQEASNAYYTMISKR